MYSLGTANHKAVQPCSFLAYDIASLESETFIRYTDNPFFSKIWLFKIRIYINLPNCKDLGYFSDWIPCDFG